MNSNQGHRVFAVIEDDIKSYLFEQILGQGWPRCSLCFFEHGLELIDALTITPADKLPTLIVLDTQTSRMDALSTLRFIKSSSRLQSIPTVLFTTDPRSQIVRRGYQLGANSIVTKSVGHSQFAEAIETVCRYWLKTAVSPVYH